MDEHGSFDSDHIIQTMKEATKFQDFKLPDGELGWRVRYVNGMRIVYVGKMVMHVSTSNNYWHMKKRATDDDNR